MEGGEDVIQYALTSNGVGAFTFCKIMGIINSRSS